MRQFRASPRLADILSKHRSEIVTSWLADIRTFKGSHYQSQPEQVLTDWAERGLDSLVEALESGSLEALDSYTKDLSLTRLNLGFEIGEVIQSLLLLREVAVPSILDEQGADSAHLAEELQRLDLCIGQMVGRFSEAFSRALHQSLERNATLEERHRLARDLHDSLSQTLYGATMLTEAAISVIEAGDTEKGTRYLVDARDTGLDALREMRLLIFELHRPDVEEEGLVDRLKTRLAAVEARAGIETVFDAEDIGRLPGPLELELYGIAQEALNNTLKHSHARRVVLRLCREGARVTMEITDDGIGFDPKKVTRGGGMGISGMADRAKEIDAEISIVSKSGDGTQIVVLVPAERPL